MTNSDIVFTTFVNHPAQLSKAALLVDSIRTFGGSLSQSYIWVFLDDRLHESCTGLKGNGTKVISLKLHEKYSDYPFTGKVTACVRAEEMAGSLYSSLVWMAPDCLVVRPPLLFQLDSGVDAALRPVHVRNVGSPSVETPDGYWQGIFRAAGVDGVKQTVESFVDCRTIRAYYNTHAFAVNPSMGLMSRWMQLFADLVSNRKFQMNQCSDEKHRVFLHQASLSTLLASELNSSRIRMLPEEYCYPYNLHEEIPEDRKALTLNELVCITYENRSLTPEEMTDIIVEEPLRTWLS